MAAAQQAALAARSRTESAGIGVETAALRRDTAAWNVHSAAQRAAAAQSRAEVAAMRAQAVAQQQVAAAGARVAGVFATIRNAAGQMAGALRAAGGAIPPIIGGFAALGAAGWSGAQRAGQAIERFIVRTAQAGIGAVGRLTGTLRRLGSGAVGAFAGLATSVGILTTAFGLFSLRSAVRFQEQLATINTVARFTEIETTQLGRALRNLAVDKGLRLDDLAASYYEFQSAGIATGAAFEDLRKNGTLLAEQNLIITNTANLAIGGLATQTEATKLMSFALNAFNLNSATISRATAAEAGITARSIGEVSKQVADYFAKSVEIGVVKASEIASTFATVASSAKIAGIGLDEIAAAYASQTRRGVSAARVAVSMNRAIQDLLQPSKTLAALQHRLGISFLEVARQRGIGTAFQLMRKEADRLGISFRDLFKRQEGWRFALNLSGKDAADYNRILQQVRDSVNETATINGVVVKGTAAIQAAIRGDTISRNLIRLQESFRSLGITIGYWFLAPVNEIIKGVTRVITVTDRWLDGLTNSQKTMARQAATLIGVVGAITALGAGLQGFLLVAGQVAPFFGATATGARALQVGVKALVLPFALLVGSIGALAFVIDNNIAGMGKFAGGLEALRTLAGGLIDILGSFVGAFVQAGRVFAEGGDAGRAFAKALDEVGQKVANIGPLFEASVRFIVQMFINLGGRIIQALATILPALGRWAISVGQTLVQGVANAMPGILRWLHALLVVFLHWAQEIAANVLPALASFGRQIISWLAGVAASVLPALASMLTSFIGWAADVARAVIPALIQLGRDIVAWLQGVIRTITPATQQLGRRLIDWISEALPAAVAALSQFFGEVAANIGAAAPRIGRAALQLGQALVNWVGSVLPTIAQALGQIAQAIIRWVGEVAPTIGAALVAWGTAFAQWFANDALPFIVSGLNTLVTNLVNWLQQTQVIRQITQAVASWAIAIIAGLGLLIARVGPEIAVQIITGLGQALIANAPMIVGAVAAIAVTFLTSLVSAILRDPVGFAGGLLALMTAQAVFLAVATAGARLAIIFITSYSKASAGLGAAVGGLFSTLGSTLGAGIRGLGTRLGATLASSMLARVALGLAGALFIIPVILDLHQQEFEQNLNKFLSNFADTHSIDEIRAKLKDLQAQASHPSLTLFGWDILGQSDAALKQIDILKGKLQERLDAPLDLQPLAASLQGSVGVFAPAGAAIAGVFGQIIDGASKALDSGNFVIKNGQIVQKTTDAWTRAGWADAVRQQGADAKKELDDAYITLGQSVVQGTSNLEATIAATAAFKIVSDEDRLRAIRVARRTAESKLAEAKSKNDTAGQIFFQSQIDDLKAQTATLLAGKSEQEKILAANTAAGTAAAKAKAAALVAQANLQNTVQTLRFGGNPEAPTRPRAPTIPVPSPKPMDDLTAALEADHIRVISALNFAPPAPVPAPSTTAVEAARDRLEDAHIRIIAALNIPAPTAPAGPGRANDNNIIPKITPAAITNAVAPVNDFVAQTNAALAPLPASVATIAANLINRLVSALNAGKTTAASSAQTVASSVLTAIGGLGNLFGSGASIIQSWLNGILSKLPAAVSAGRRVAAAVGVHLIAQSPPKVGPLRDIVVWAHRTIEAYAEGISSSASLARDASLRVAGAAADSLSKPPQFQFAPAYGLAPSAERTIAPIGMGNRRAGYSDGPSDRAVWERQTELLSQIAAASSLNAAASSRIASTDPVAGGPLAATGTISALRHLQHGKN